MLPTPRPRVRTRGISQASRPALASAPALNRLKIEYVPLSELKLSKVRLRKHPERQIEHLMGGLQRLGFLLPILADKNNTIIDGEAVVEAARRNGLQQVPIVRNEHLTNEEARMVRIALNQLPMLSSWDETVLRTELKALTSIDFDLPTFTGFSSVELDYWTATPTDDAGSPEGDLRVPAPGEIVSLIGDVWAFAGGHRLGCLNTLDEASFATLMGDELAGVTVSDAPYNVAINGHVTRRAGARDFAMASGEMSSEAFTDFLATSFRHSAAHSRDGSLSLQFMDWRHIEEMMAAGRTVYGTLVNVAVWAKTNPGMGAPWRSGHELCFVWKKGSAPHVDNVQLGRIGRNRSNVWTYPGANQHRDRGSEGHVTPKNLAMIQDAILDVSNRGDIVLDAFAGSGTTLVAAHLAGRRGYGLELDPAYVDLAVRRLEDRTGAPARHLETGLTFAEMAAQRGVPLPSPTQAR